MESQSACSVVEIREYKMKNKERRVEDSGKHTRTDSMSPRQKSMASSMPHPVVPFSKMVVNIARGTFKAGFSISSAICIGRLVVLEFV
jgi:hypothetical protein